MVDAYLSVTDPYPYDLVEEMCRKFLAEGRHMPLPVQLADSLRSEMRIRENSTRYLAPNIVRAGAEIARKAVDDFMRKTGQKRRGK